MIKYGSSKKTTLSESFKKSDIYCKNLRKYCIAKSAALLFILKCNQIASFSWLCIIQFDAFDQATCFLNLFWETWYLSSSRKFQTTITHTNSETNPLHPFINVVCKFLRQFLGRSFGVATLPIYYNIFKYLRQFLGTSFGVATMPIYCNIE